MNDNDHLDDAVKNGPGSTAVGCAPSHDPAHAQATMPSIPIAPARKYSDKDVLSIARGFRRGMLSGETPEMKCFMVTAPLLGYLQFMGIRAEMHEGSVWLENANEIWQHFWIKLPDGRILDPTASQFNGKSKRKMPVVYIGAIPEHYSYNSVSA